MLPPGTAFSSPAHSRIRGWPLVCKMWPLRSLIVSIHGSSRSIVTADSMSGCATARRQDRSCSASSSAADNTTGTRGKYGFTPSRWLRAHEARMLGRTCSNPRSSPAISASQAAVTACMS